MSDNIFLPDEHSPGRRSFSFGASAIGAVVVIAVMSWFIYSQFRIDVPENHVAILIAKTGKDIPNNEEVAPTEEYRGVQREMLPEGRYFRNPYLFDWKVIPKVEIEQGKMGVLVSLAGDDLPYGEFVAKVDENGDPTTKGIVPGVLRSGRYAVHPYLFEVQAYDPTTIPAGFQGVVTNLAGPLPGGKNIEGEEADAKQLRKNPLLSDKGDRGVQGETLDSQTVWVNPFEKRIDLIDCKSRRFDLAAQKNMGFPSKDGFWIDLKGSIEFKVMPDRAAEVFVNYNDVTNDAQKSVIDEEIIRKVILPNARSFCRLQGSNIRGVDFITTREKFQDDFLTAMREACEPQGIEILNINISSIKPPEKIMEPLQDREVAKQQELQYQDQIIQQESEKDLAIEQGLVKQKQELIKAQQEVIKLTTDARRKQEVAVTKANERQEVANLNLQAAKDQAAAILARGNADAKVVQFENEAAAAGWKESVAAFNGDGAAYARYVLYQKMATAYRKIMVNTADSPIMKIFDSFATDNGKPAVEPANP